MLRAAFRADNQNIRTPLECQFGVPVPGRVEKGTSVGIRNLPVYNAREFKGSLSQFVIRGMSMLRAEPRLGDLIDDHCPRCRLLLNHAIASMVDGQVVKVICQTCYSEHAYQRGQGGKKKTGPRATLFDQVLAKVSPAEADPEDAPAKKKPAEPARNIARRKGKSPRSKS